MDGSTGSQIELIFNSKTFLIPSHFHSISDINQNLYKEILCNHYYEVKSEVNEEAFLSFINHWINNEVPNINSDNISEYTQLSNEFGRMKDLIELYKKIDSRSGISFFTNRKIKLENQIQKEKEIYQEKMRNYQKIIQILFNNDAISLYLGNKSKLINACKKERVDYINFLTTNKITDENGLIYILDYENKEAGVVGKVDSINDILIPKSIIYGSNEFLVTAILERAFYKCKSIKNVYFPENSEIRKIDKNSFAGSSLESIKIPPKVTKISDYAFCGLNQIEKIEFSESSNLQIIEEEAFSYSALKNINFPQSLTTIGKRSFAATSIQKVDLSNNFNLHSICKSAFSCSLVSNLSLPSSVGDLQDGWCVGLGGVNEISIKKYDIENIKLYENRFIIGKSDSKSENFDVIRFSIQTVEKVVIPSFIKRIAQNAFDGCSNLREVEIESLSIGKKAFFMCPIEKLIVKSKFLNLDEGWCNNIKNLNKLFLSPKNEEFAYLDDKFLIGKSNKDSQIYDVLFFARRDIETAIIPSFIKKIGSFAFQNCMNLKTVIFSEDSKLMSIGKCAFENTSIEKISIPKNVIQIDTKAFHSCSKFKSIEFHHDSELKVIGKLAFNFSSLERIMIPKRVFSIGNKCFSPAFLKLIEFDEDSELTIFNIERILMLRRNVEFMIPSGLRKRLRIY